MTRSNTFYCRWFLVILMILTNTTLALGQEQQTRSGGAFVNDSDGGTLHQGWSAAGNAIASDNLRASATLNGVDDPNDLNTHILRASNFGFSIPPGVTIDGFLVEVEASKGGSGSLLIGSNLVKTEWFDWSGGKQTGFPATESYIAFGGSTDRWGKSWTPAEINASNFGVGVFAFSNDENTATAYVDHLRVTVFYTLPPPPNAPNLNSPADLSINISPSPTFAWGVSSGALHYRLQVSTSPDFSTTVYDKDTITVTSRAIEGLAGLTQFYWRVNATNSGGTGSWSVARSFTTDATQMRSGGTFVNDASLGTVDWSYPGNAQTSDNLVASASLQSGYSSRHLRVTNFNFSIPNDANVNGIEVQVERRRSGSSSSISTYSAKLVKNGTIDGTNKANPGTTWPTSDANDTYGGPTDTWGLTLTPSDVNSAEFGFVISAYNSGSTGGSIIDHIRIKIFYSFPLPAPTLAFPGEGGMEVSTLPTLSWNFGWNPVLGSDSFRFQLSTDPSFSSTVVDQSDIAATSKGVTGLTDFTTYYWRVNASNAVETTAWSAPRSFTAMSPPPAGVVISQIYTSGGNGGAPYGTPYKNDFVELLNRTGGSITLNGWSIQHTEATGSTWSVIPLTGSISPGNYYLIKLGSGGSSGTTELPAPDVTATLNLSLTGKIALVNSTTPLSGSSPIGAHSIIDFVGYGSTANAYEGNGPTANPDVIRAVLRLDGGNTDTNNNAQDFIVAHPTPRNGGKWVIQSGGAFAIDAILGTVNWSSAASVQASDDARAYSSLNYSQSKYLRVTNFGFNIPSEAGITGVLVEIERRREGLGAIQDYSVKIIQNDTIRGNEKKYHGITWPFAVDVYRLYGGSTDLWGLAWTADEINSSNFGVAVSAAEMYATSGVAKIDHIQITVYYTFSPQAPVPASPANAATDISTSPTLSWNASNGATSYRLQLSTNSDFATTVFDQSGISSTSHQVTGLSYSTGYYWRLNATTPGETSDWSSVQSFTTVPPPPAAPALVSPLNGATGVSASITMEWNSSPGASSYLLQWSTDSSFTSGDSVSITQTSRVLSGLLYETTYWWKVTARNDAGQTASGSRSFTTGPIPPPPDPPEITLLSGDTTAVSPWPLFSWTASPQDTVYRLQIFQGSQTILDDSSITSPTFELGFLQESATYTWQVKAKNAGGWSNYSDLASFTTGSRPSLPEYVTEEDLAYFAAIDSFDVYLKTGSTTALTFVEAEYADYLAGLTGTQPNPHKKMKLKFNNRSVLYEVDDFISDSLTAIYVSYRDSIRASTITSIHKGGGLPDDVQVPEDAEIVFHQVTDSSGYLSMTGRGVDAKFHKGGDFAGCNFRMIYDVRITAHWKLIADSDSYRIRIHTVTARPSNVRMDGKPRLGVWLPGFGYCYFFASLQEMVENLFPKIERQAKDITKTILSCASVPGTPDEQLFTEIKNSFPIRITMSSPSPNNVTLELKFMEGLTPNSTEFVGHPPEIVQSPSLDHIGFAMPPYAFQTAHTSIIQFWDPQDQPCLTDPDCQEYILTKARELSTQSIRMEIPWKEIVGELTYEGGLHPDNLVGPTLNAKVEELLGRSTWQLTDQAINQAHAQRFDVILQLLQGHTGKIPIMNGDPMAPGTVTPGRENDFYSVDSSTFLYHLKIFAHAAVRRYRNKIGIWIAENELNAAKFAHLAFGWREGSLWGDDSEDGFQDRVWAILRDAIRTEDPSARILVPLHMLNIVKGIERFGRDADIIGVNFYPNYVFATPILGMAVGEMVWATRRVLKGLENISPHFQWAKKEVYVTETSYPGVINDASIDAPGSIGLDSNLTYYSYGRQKKYMQDAITTVTTEGGKGFFWWGLLDRENYYSQEFYGRYGGLIVPNTAPSQFKTEAVNGFNSEVEAKHPGKANVLLENRNLSTNDILGGRLSIVGERDSLISGDTVAVVRERTKKSRSDQQFLQDSQHQRWDLSASQFRLKEDFSIAQGPSLVPRIAFFGPTFPVTINSNVADQSTPIQIRDPWHLEPITGEQPDEFREMPEETSKVFLEQGGVITSLSPPYYSLRAPLHVNDAQGRKWRFSNWDATDATIESSDSAKTAVIFHSANALVSAEYTLLPTGPASPPILLGPVNGATNISLSPTLMWDGSTNAETYNLQVSTDSTFNTNIILNDSTLADTTHQAGPFTGGTTFFWRVRAQNSQGWGFWSFHWSFTTALTPPTLASPANGSGNVSISPTLSWNTSTGVSKYHVRCSTDPNFSWSLADSTSGTSLTLSGLVGSTTYYWRVWASNATSTSIPSPVWSFTATMTPPDIPQRSSPANGSTGLSTSPALSWGQAFQAETYEVRWSTDPTFNSYHSASTTSMSIALSGLAGLTTYFWRIQAENSAGASGWTQNWSFTTEAVPPATPYPSYPLNGATGLSSTVPLGWSAPSGATSYTVEWGTSPTLSGASSATTTDSWHSVYGLSLSTVYYWRVKASNSAGTSSWSSIVSFTTDCEQAGAPQWVDANWAGPDLYTRIDLSWDFLSGSCSVAYFNVFRRHEGTNYQWELIGSVLIGPSWVYEDYVPYPGMDCSYHYYVTTVDSFGRESGPSPIIIVEP